MFWWDLRVFFRNSIVFFLTGDNLTSSLTILNAFGFYLFSYALAYPSKLMNDVNESPHFILGFRGNSFSFPHSV